MVTHIHAYIAIIQQVNYKGGKISNFCRFCWILKNLTTKNWDILITDAEEIILELIQQEKPLKPGSQVSLASYSIIINFGGQWVCKME